MSSADRMENAAKVKKAVTLASNGDRDAEAYLYLIAHITRVIDDLYDQDSPTPPEVVASMAGAILVQLPMNPFYRYNRDRLDAAHAMVLNAWLDSNRMDESADRLEWNYGRVVRDYVNELLPLVACLVSGYTYMRTVSLPIRQLFYKDELKNKGE